MTRIGRRSGRALMKKHHRRNPVQGIRRPSLGQWFLKLGLPMNDPIVELGAAWAAGVYVDSRLMRQAQISAERWMENRDRKLAGMGRTVANKLSALIKEAEGHERRASPYKAGTLIGRSNPKRRKKSRFKKRRNPYYEDFSARQLMKEARPSKRQVAAARRALKRLSKSKRSKVAMGVIGMMNPRGRKRGGARFTKARRGRKWESTVHGSLPWFSNPGCFPMRPKGRR